MWINIRTESVIFFIYEALLFITKNGELFLQGCNPAQSLNSLKSGRCKISWFH